MWFWNDATEQMGRGPALAEPSAHPEDQSATGPQGQVPDTWRDLIHT